MHACAMSSPCLCCPLVDEGPCLPRFSVLLISLDMDAVTGSGTHQKPLPQPKRLFWAQLFPPNQTKDKQHQEKPQTRPWKQSLHRSQLSESVALMSQNGSFSRRGSTETGLESLVQRGRTMWAHRKRLPAALLELRLHSTPISEGTWVQILC